MAASGAMAERALAELILVHEPDEAARVMETGSDEETARLLESVPPDLAITVVRRLTGDTGSQVIAKLSPEARARVLASLNPNQAANVLARLDDDRRETILDGLSPSLAAEFRELLRYPPETAGALMDPRVTSFHPEATVHDVVETLRRLRGRRVQDIFVVDYEGRLVGAIPLDDIFLTGEETRLDGLVAAPPVAVQAVASRDEIIQTFEAHRIGSMPVVDLDGRLIGVLRQRELIQAAQERASASAVTMVGASEQERALSSPLFAVRKRLPWLQINLLTAFLAASVVGIFEDTIARVTALAVLLPVVAGQSGNTGAQALAVTMRGLALREVRTRHWLKVAVKETFAGAGNGVAVALVTAIAVFFWSQSIGLALVIGISMVISMTLAGLAGAVIPMALTAVGQDPAQSSSIILTTVTDVAGFFSFLGIATLLMQML